MAAVPAPARIASPPEVQRMSWHQRQAYQRYVRRWLDAEARAQREAWAAGSVESRLRRIIAELAQACREYDQARDLRVSRERYRCGTRSALNRHLVAGEQPCQECLAGREARLRSSRAARAAEAVPA